MTDSVVDSKTEVKQATKYVKETENVAEKYSAMTVSKNSSDVNMNVGEMPSAAFTAVPTLKSVKKVRNVMLAISQSVSQSVHSLRAKEEDVRRIVRIVLQ